jgi:hypothetical protein
MIDRLETMHNVRKSMIELATNRRQSFETFVNQAFDQTLVENKDQARYWVKTWLDSDPDFNYEADTDSYGYRDYI